MNEEEKMQVEEEEDEKSILGKYQMKYRGNPLMERKVFCGPAARKGDGGSIFDC